MAEIEIVSEKEEPGGWSFQVRIGEGASDDVTRTLRLSWADYNLWSHDGGDPPHAVARAVALFLLSRISAADVPVTIDASTARRRFPDADDEIPKLI